MTAPSGSPEAHRFGAALRQERSQARLSQAALADRMGCDPSTISKWENGHILDPPPRRIIREIEEALGIANARLQAAAGYASLGAQPVVTYAKPALTADQEAAVLEYIDWVRRRQGS